MFDAVITSCRAHVKKSYTFFQFRWFFFFHLTQKTITLTQLCKSVPSLATLRERSIFINTVNEMSPKPQTPPTSLLAKSTNEPITRITISKRTQSLKRNYNNNLVPILITINDRVKFIRVPDYLPRTNPQI